MVKEQALTLFQALRQGNTEAFAFIYDQYQAPIYRYLCSHVRDRRLAEDLTQDTFVKAYRALAQGSEPANLKAWLYTIATNTALSNLRRRRLIAWLPFQGRAEDTPEALVADETESLGERELVRRAMASLSHGEAACLLLRFAQGLSYEEVAEVHGITVAAAKMRLSRARSAFREAYLRLSKEDER